MLLALLSGQRCQTLHCLSVSSMKMSDSKCVFTVDVLLKQSRKGKHLAPKENKLLLSYQAPHKPVSKNTGQMAGHVLNGAGVDTKQFRAHSTRESSTSAALSSSK